MSRHQIAQRMRRISEVREQIARSAVSAANKQVDDTQAEIEQIAAESRTSEQQLLSSEPMLSGAWLQVLAQARDTTRHQLDEAENRLLMAEQNLSERKTEHMAKAKKRFAHDEIASRLRREWKGELQKAAQKELDDVANARAGRQEG